MDNYKIKISVFILLVAFLLITLFYGIFGFSLSYLSEEEIKEERVLKEDLINFLKINNIDAVYDADNNTYYYSIPDEYENKKYTLKLELDDGYKYKIIDYSTNVITVNYQKVLNIIIYNDKYYYEARVQLTNLPLIDITTDTEITDNDTNSIFKYINPSNLDEIVVYNSKIKIRGATSKNYDKKSYKIEMYNNDYNKEKSVNISNFYYGSAFILDATYRDNSKIRNVLATELWNSISDDFNNVNVYSEFVEVFINGKYMGVYVFTEPINRKKLNLNKSSLNDTSVIIKTTTWEIPNLQNNFTNIIDDLYLGYELKYPNDEMLFTVSWNKILTKLSKYYSTIDIINDEEISINFFSTYDETNEIFNINNYIDLVIFNSFIDNSDNQMIKNNYFYVKNLNDKLYIQPWDMEFSFGLRHSSNIEYLSLKNIENYFEISLDIYHENSDEINDLLINRYWELRKSVLNEEYLDSILDNYINDLNKGAAKRDSNIWFEYDVEKEIEDIRSWIHNRIEVYDEYIKVLGKR